MGRGKPERRLGGPRRKLCSGKTEKRDAGCEPSPGERTANALRLASQGLGGGVAKTI